MNHLRQNALICGTIWQTQISIIAATAVCKNWCSNILLSKIHPRKSKSTICTFLLLLCILPATYTLMRVRVANITSDTGQSWYTLLNHTHFSHQHTTQHTRSLASVTFSYTCVAHLQCSNVLYNCQVSSHHSRNKLHLSREQTHIPIFLVLFVLNLARK